MEPQNHIEDRVNEAKRKENEIKEENHIAVTKFLNSAMVSEMGANLCKIDCTNPEFVRGFWKAVEALKAYGAKPSSKPYY